jgi:hypothetical protein
LIKEKKGYDHEFPDMDGSEFQFFHGYN